MSGEEDPHGILLGGIRRGVRGHRACSQGSGGPLETAGTRLGTDIHGCSSGNDAHEPRRTPPRPDLRRALQAREAITTLRKQEPTIEIEIRWCPARKGIPGNEIADEWAIQAASEPDEHGVEWLWHVDRVGRRAPPATSLAHLRRGASEKKWRFSTAGSS